MLWRPRQPSHWRQKRLTDLQGEVIPRATRRTVQAEDLRRCRRIPDPIQRGAGAGFADSAFGAGRASGRCSRSAAQTTVRSNSASLAVG